MVLFTLLTANLNLNLHPHLTPILVYTNVHFQILGARTDVTREGYDAPGWYAEVYLLAGVRPRPLSPPRHWSVRSLAS